MDMKYVFPVLALAVVAVFFGSWVASGAGNSNDPTGEWELVMHEFGYYQDGEPVYIQTDDYLTASIERYQDSEDCYLLTMGGNTTLCTMCDGYMMTLDAYGDETAYPGYLYMERGKLIVKTVSYLGVDVLTFKRTASGSDSMVDAQSAINTDKNIPKVGTVLNGISATKISGDGVEDRTDLNYTLTVDRLESSMVFYTVTNDIDETFRFVATKAGSDYYMATAEYDSWNFIFDMVRFTDGVVYTTTFDKIGEIAQYEVIYGDESKLKPVEADLKERVYVGSEKSYILDNGEVIDNESVDIRLYFVYQQGNMVQVFTMAGAENIGMWGGILYQSGDHYSMIVESIAIYHSEMFQGQYYCTFSEDMGTLEIHGALVTESGSSVVIHQTYQYDEDLIVYG